MSDSAPSAVPPSGEPASQNATVTRTKRAKFRMFWLLVSLFVGTLLVNLVVLGILLSIFERRQEATRPSLRIVEVDELTTNPAPGVSTGHISTTPISQPSTWNGPNTGVPVPCPPASWSNFPG